MATKMFIQYKVADFKKWKAIYDGMGATRKQFGSTGDQVFVNPQNPNEVLIITEWGNKEQAMKYRQAPELKKAMESAGIMSAPETSFTE